MISRVPVPSTLRGAGWVGRAVVDGHGRWRKPDQNSPRGSPAPDDAKDSPSFAEGHEERAETKQGALTGTTALAQVKASGAFTVSHQRYWVVVRRARGDAAGTRALVEFLMAHRTLEPAGVGVAPPAWRPHPGEAIFVCESRRAVRRRGVGIRLPLRGGACR
jgi:hypothetical protein